MLILAFDTATERATSALVRDGNVLGERTSRASRVLADADELLRETGVEETDLTHLAVGDVVTVAGELGSGKTTFVRGACGALGVRERVTSPTYTIGHRYHGDGVEISHLDLYRFEGVSPAEWGDLEPYFERAIAFVEWPEAGEGVLPAPRFAVRLRHAGAGRALEIEEC